MKILCSECKTPVKIKWRTKQTVAHKRDTGKTRKRWMTGDPFLGTRSGYYDEKIWEWCPGSLRGDCYEKKIFARTND